MIPQVRGPLPKKLLARSLFIMLLGLVLVSCASNSARATRKHFIEVFITDIRANGSKLFRYSLSPKASQNITPNIARQHEGRYSQSAGTGSAKTVARIARILDHGLGKKLQETAYCRDGFFELERFVSRGGSEIRGECREAASEADRQKF